MPFFDKYAQRDKHLLRLERELARLGEAQENAPVIPLEHPYQRGWVKTYALRPDALHHPDAAIFQALLAVVNECVHSRNREFRRRNGDQLELHPRIVPPQEWIRRAWPVRYHQWFAYGSWRVEETWGWAWRGYPRHVVGFKLTRGWWLEEEVRPHMITHRRVELPAVRSRIAEIEAHLEARLGWYRLHWLHGKHSRWRSPDLAAEQRAAASFADQCE